MEPIDSLENLARENLIREHNGRDKTKFRIVVEGIRSGYTRKRKKIECLGDDKKKGGT